MRDLISEKFNNEIQDKVLQIVKTDVVPQIKTELANEMKSSLGISTIADSIGEFKEDLSEYSQPSE